MEGLQTDSLATTTFNLSPLTGSTDILGLIAPESSDFPLTEPFSDWDYIFPPSALDTDLGISSTELLEATFTLTTFSANVEASTTLAPACKDLELEGVQPLEAPAAASCDGVQPLEAPAAASCDGVPLVAATTVESSDEFSDVPVSTAENPSDASAPSVLLLPPAEFDALLKASPELTPEDIAGLRRDRRRALNRTYQHKSRQRRIAAAGAGMQAPSRVRDFAYGVRKLAEHHFGSSQAGAEFLRALAALETDTMTAMEGQQQ